MSDIQPDKKEPPSADVNYRFKAGMFLTAVTGVSASVAFALTLASAKKKDPQMFEKGAQITRELPESGVSLAMRALKWATFYSFTGCGLLFYGIWKLSGAENLQDFRVKMGNLLPRVAKHDPPQSRTEFSGLNDLLNYLNNDYGKDKNSSKRKSEETNAEGGKNND